MKRLDGKARMLAGLVSIPLIFFFVLVSITPASHAAGEKTEAVPTLKVGYIFTNHHTPLLVAASKGEDFKGMGVWLKPIVAKERYELIADGKKAAIIDLVVTKNGAESTTLFAQKHLDMGLASITAVMAGIDQGTRLKIVSPLQVEGIGLVFPKDSAVNDWDGLMTYIGSAKEPVKIGYHSPTSAPKIVIEKALVQAGVKVSQDPNDSAARVLLVDLKTTSNLIPALVGKQVDAWVGPSPFPEVAVAQGAGKIAADLRAFPPKGYWNDFPCCVVAAREDVEKQYPEAVQGFVEIIARTGDWCNRNKAEAGDLTAEWIGIPAEAAKASSLLYVTSFSDQWIRGAGTYLEILDGMGNFKGQLKSKTVNDVKPMMIDATFIDKVKIR